MPHFPKVIWFEGMNLDPHHFQQWDRHHLAEIDARFRSLLRYQWGFTEILINKDALPNGKFELQRCNGITPDGLPFNMPDNDPLPSARDINKAFLATQDTLEVYLAIPAERPGGQNCLLQGTPDTRTTRYCSEEIHINDDNTGSDPRLLTIGRKNFQIRVSGESLEDFSTLKMAEIRRLPDGTFSLMDNFIPASLVVAASDPLKKLMRKLLELLVANSKDLMSKRRHQEYRQFNISSTTDVELFWRLHTVNTFIPVLNYYYQSPQIHPEELYHVLLMLIGQLTTFSSKSDQPPTDLPVYNQKDLAGCFNFLMTRIEDLLREIFRPEWLVRFPLEQRSETLFEANIKDIALLETAKFYIECKHELNDNMVIQEFPRAVIIATPETIRQHINFAISALQVKASEHAPEGLSAKSGTQYFQINNKDEFWKQITESQTISIYLPKDKFPELKLGLIAIRTN